MAKVYEALRRAERERRGEGPDEPIVKGAPRKSSPPLHQKLAAVYRAIESKLSGESCAVVMFVSTHGGDGVSALVRVFAHVVSEELGKRVALLDGHPGESGHFEYFGVHPQDDSAGAGREDRSLESILQSTEGGKLFLGHFSNSDWTRSGFFAGDEFKQRIDNLRSQFELIVLDVPPGAESSHVLLAVASTDGVVLVVESERTRWQVADRLRERIELQGGKVIGAILNNRRFYIPKFIYKRL